MTQTTPQNRKKEFLGKLKNLLKEYDATIEFTCNGSSDTYGLYDDHLEISMREKGCKDEVVFKSNGWFISSEDIK